MEFNIVDPEADDFHVRVCSEEVPATKRRGYANFMLKMLEQRGTIVLPFPTKTFTQEELTQMGYVGVRLKTKNFG